MLRQSASKSPFAFHSRVAAREKCWVQTFVWAPRPQLGCRRGMAEAQMLVPGSVLVADAVGNVFINVELGFAPPRAEAPAGPVRREHARASSTRQSAAPNVAEEPPVAAGRWEPGQARNSISVERLQRAFLAGQFGQQKVQRQIQRVPPTPVFGGAADDKRCFVLLRGRPGARLEGYYLPRHRGSKGAQNPRAALTHSQLLRVVARGRCNPLTFSVRAGCQLRFDEGLRAVRLNVT